MKIYTRTGDKGETSLLGGSRVSKSDLQIEAYGTVDELNSWMGLIKDNTNLQEVKNEVLSIQEKLFEIGSNLALEPGKEMDLPRISEENIERLEKSIDAMNEILEPMKNFILPGGSVVVSNIHIARTICRRAERRVVAFGINEPGLDPIIRYLNRLSDYLFVLARYVAKKTGVPEIPWKGKG